MSRPMSGPKSPLSGPRLPHLLDPKSHPSALLPAVNSCSRRERRAAVLRPRSSEGATGKMYQRQAGRTTVAFVSGSKPQSAGSQSSAVPRQKHGQDHLDERRRHDLALLTRATAGRERCARAGRRQLRSFSAVSSTAVSNSVGEADATPSMRSRSDLCIASGTAQGRLDPAAKLRFSPRRNQSRLPRPQRALRTGSTEKIPLPGCRSLSEAGTKMVPRMAALFLSEHELARSEQSQTHMERETDT